MSDKPRKGSFTGSGLLIALAIAVAMLVTVAGPTSAQFFNFGFQPQPPQRGGWFGGGGWFGNEPFEPPNRRAPVPRQARPPPVREDFSKAPPPEKPETASEHQILVLGD